MQMRVPTDLWVKALLRRCHAAGATAVIARHGDAEAGVAIVKIRLLDGTVKLLGPPPAGSVGNDGMPKLEPLLKSEVVPEADADAYITRQIGFDPDIWVVEIDDRLGRTFVGD